MRARPAPSIIATLFAAGAVLAGSGAGAAGLDRQAIADAGGTQATAKGDVVRIGWTRNDVPVQVNGIPLPPAAGLGSWAAFKPSGETGNALVMGDTVVFQDEVDAALDAVFAHGLEVTALHNHFFYDEPKAYFMHIGGHGPATELAGAVKAIWQAIKAVRAAEPQPARGVAGATPEPGGAIDLQRIESITGLRAEEKNGGVVKISTGRSASMHGTEIDAGMGLASWAAFTGSDELATMDGDFIMTAAEVQPVLKALRGADLHVVALHNHMIGEQPAYYFTHFWGEGPAADLARGFKAALDAQSATSE